METNSLFKIGAACRVGVLSSLVALATVGDSFGQEELVLDGLKLLRPPGEACMVTFGAGEGLQILGRSSSDLKCWVFVGACNEFNEGNYQFTDPGAIELPDQFYRFETFNPEVPLPPQFEQLRMELGDEGFAQWLQVNFEEFGSLQGMQLADVMNLDPLGQQQYQEIEDVLFYWLEDFGNQAAPPMPEVIIPPHFEELRLEWGDYDFGQFLVQNLDQWGNFQGICEPLVIEWEVNEPIIFEKFVFEEQGLEIWFEDYILELPPIILETFDKKDPLPQHLEQLRMELGDEAFSEWLHRNREETGNHQGIDEGSLPEHARDDFEALEAILEGWLSEFEQHGRR